MNHIQIRSKLKNMLELELNKVITSDFILLDVPFHDNSGDVLIWQGTVDYLKGRPYKDLGHFSADTFDFRGLDEKTVILLQGGGNFGDLYSYFHEFKMKVIMHYPNNKIVFLPQTIFYENLDNFYKDMQLINSHKNIVFCARDHVSYNLFLNEKQSRVQLLLLPDMAFCISEKLLSKTSAKYENIYMKRIDGELSHTKLKHIDALKFDRVADWPTYSEPETKEMKKLKTLLVWLSRVKRRVPFLVKPLEKMTNQYGNNFFRMHIVNQAIEFIGDYDQVVTTRLHGCILAVLLGKKILLIDNSYGKNSNFYNAWLKEYENIELVSSENGYVA